MTSANCSRSLYAPILHCLYEALRFVLIGMTGIVWTQLRGNQVRNDMVKSIRGAFSGFERLSRIQILYKHMRSMKAS